MRVQTKVEATLSSKGQLTIPKNIRQLLNIKTGSKVVFMVLADGKIEIDNADNLQSEKDVQNELANYYRKYGQVELEETDRMLEDFVGDWVS
ncbi:hypothetical protein Hs30E_01830 [Lactococcus hodotermopsidis]|uniref:SpoVT-AbrB domain-containing protein n=1 Tax=Pseudolactococcus hodotermopsidis TaxID=2709157 RepID=A0A6A0B8I2_9LACT|nr:AbrB/MazE/SpoVT family DNA-binding domain-containing protein [Lactococcus hodotermopsidis]GFH41632.1 hypothetical protein Hs30E_01830 [Lactococcus hodotermopsidis]